MEVRWRCGLELGGFGRGRGGAGPAVYATALLEDICFVRPHQSAGAGDVVGSAALAVLGFALI